VPKPEVSMTPLTGPGREVNVRLSEIQKQIGTGEYRVQPMAVADAIVRRLLAERELAVAPRDGAHPECS